jgi:hypothetical protein
MQGKSRMDRELLDAGEMAGHLVPAGSVFAFLAVAQAFWAARQANAALPEGLPGLLCAWSFVVSGADIFRETGHGCPVSAIASGRTWETTCS